MCSQPSDPDARSTLSLWLSSGCAGDVARPFAIACAKNTLNYFDRSSGVIRSSALSICSFLTHPALSTERARRSRGTSSWLPSGNSFRIFRVLVNRAHRRLLPWPTSPPQPTQALLLLLKTGKFGFLCLPSPSPLILLFCTTHVRLGAWSGYDFTLEGHPGAQIMDSAAIAPI